MRESGKAEVWAKGQVEVKEEWIVDEVRTSEAESACKRNTPAHAKARLRALSQELTEADRRLFGDEWDDDARSVRTDTRQIQYLEIPTASERARGWRHHDEPSHNYNRTALRCVMLNTRSERKSSGLAAP